MAEKRRNIYGTARREHVVRYRDDRGRDIELYGVIEAPAAEGRFPAVVLCHGFNGHHSDFPAECARWGGMGFVCYAFDFCGAQRMGRSTGRGAEDYTPFTMVQDLRAAVRDVAALENVDPERVFLFGGSQGGLVAGLAAADRELGIRGLAMYFPAFLIPENWRGAPERTTQLMGYSIGPEYIRSVQEPDPYAVIPGFPGRVCIVTGDRDTIVTGGTIRRAVEAYGAGRVELTVIPGAGHGFTGEALDAAVERVLGFLEAQANDGQ